MKITLFFATVVSLSIAEPPVGDGYPSTNSAHNHGNHLQRSKDHSQKYGAPNVQQQTRNQKHSSAPLQNNLSPKKYGAPDSRSALSDTYGSPFERSSPSSQYGAPKVQNVDLSQEYGAPSSRNFPSQNYGASASARASQKYGAPSSRNAGVSQQYVVPASRNSHATSFRSKGYHSEEHSDFQRNSDSGHQAGDDSYSQSYDANQRGISQNHGSPLESIDDLKTGAYASPFTSSRSTLSHKYGPPSGRSLLNSNGPPSQQGRASSALAENYGAPQQYDGLSNQDGYSYEENDLEDLEELLNQEPANYNFGYKVEDYESGSDFGHEESRNEDRAEGSYFVVLPDGSKQIVEYEADENGFRPKIRVEPADISSRSGYDDNASDKNGPY